jgi:prolyl-tRNA synthetase
MSENKKSQEGITIKKEEDISEWYEQICLKSELAEFSPVKGSIIIRPRGYYIWESIQEYFNKKIVEKTHCENAYFPLFIPESFFKKESEHAAGFSPEVAWIDKELTKDSERLAIRPTSETIMYDSYSKWIRSYKDMPLRINQWCNVVRWETNATKLFLRSREFLWQEGHCVYSSEKECDKETLNYIKLYAKLCKELLSIPVIIGKKTDSEKFAGAEYTLTIESFMPDGKALQCGTSHNLGTGFAKAFGISYIGQDEKKHLPWQNSWGVSTRLIGGTVMIHSDNKGLVLPPKISKNKVVIIPIFFESSKKQVMEKSKEIFSKLKKFDPIYDSREEISPGRKFSEWELKGIPLRIEIGPKDLENKSLTVVKRNTSEKLQIKISEVAKKIPEILDKMQNELYEKAKIKLDEDIVKAKTWEDFKNAIKNKKIVEINWCGDENCEKEIKEKTGAGSRCIKLGKNKISGICPHCKKPSKMIVYFSKSY